MNKMNQQCQLNISNIILFNTLTLDANGLKGCTLGSCVCHKNSYKGHTILLSHVSRTYFAFNLRPIT